MHIKRGLILLTRRPMPEPPAKPRPLRHPVRPPYIYRQARRTAYILLPAPLENHQHQPKPIKMMKLYYHRINNGLAAYVAAPAAYVASAPYVAAAAPYVASPYVSAPYVASPYSAPIVAV
ncbi:hypothetical protein MSG28_005175 [Choristoneura fumiferana]|uniref:Uncharacterized protein n=1 Tax=Choristoneura fumiferana TaxID=7141 RepID=A0ACC0JQ98_CHOFU|nr:hypothetical protein MSG28_005175 [Choristoneura fumiferana]